MSEPIEKRERDWSVIVGTAIFILLFLLAVYASRNDSSISTPQQGCSVEDTGGGTAC